MYTVPQGSPEAGELHLHHVTIGQAYAFAEAESIGAEEMHVDIARTAVRLEPRNPFAQSEPRLAQLPDYFDLLSKNYVSQGLYDDGLKTSERAYRLAAAAGRSQQAARLQQRAEYCRNLLAPKPAAQPR